VGFPWREPKNPNKFQIKMEENNMEENQNQDGVVKIKLDGSYGTGVIAELTIITKDGENDKEETFIFPYHFIDFSAVQGFDRLNLIKGYKITKQEKPSALKELGL
jgi:hypothetical protein